MVCRLKWFCIGMWWVFFIVLNCFISFSFFVFGFKVIISLFEILFGKCFDNVNIYFFVL